MSGTHPRSAVLARTTSRLGVGCVAAIALLASDAAAAGPAAIEAEVARLAQGAGGVTGVAAWMLDGKGPRVLVNAQERYPMASTYKVAIAGAVLASVDAGRLDLGQMVTIEPADRVPSDLIADRLVHPGISLSVHNLLELMLTESDNTATDVLMRLAGGPQAVTAWVLGQGVADLRVDRNTYALIREFLQLPPGPLGETFEAALEKDPSLEEKTTLPNPSFDEDPRDTATPVAMAELVTRIFNGTALSADSTKHIIEIMERCRTGESRLPGRLPPGSVIAHKTGTIGGTVNDVGVVTLPGDGKRLVIAVFIKKSDKPVEERERTIAEIARSVRDYYLLQD
jgi:beta-lactamase class A